MGGVDANYTGEGLRASHLGAVPLAIRFCNKPTAHLWRVIAQRTRVAHQLRSPNVAPEAVRRLVRIMADGRMCFDGDATVHTVWIPNMKPSGSGHDLHHLLLC